MQRAVGQVILGGRDMNLFLVFHPFVFKFSCVREKIPVEYQTRTLARLV